jgi:hypothetical protein
MFNVFLTTLSNPRPTLPTLLPLSSASPAPSLVMNAAKQFAKNRQAVTWTFLLFPLPLGVYYIGKSYPPPPPSFVVVRFLSHANAVSFSSLSLLQVLGQGADARGAR